ncbi:RHS repeat-associated core domain-containing protein [Saccharopolyspora spinosa]|uniref:RHS repeat-associated core domain-containing protein n=1 Tax=Saccharopolyspora spinosa TaxID=60894 RepID=UPI002011F77F|nr:RHS repeat-associated core domain-containing protein [Saccharopolyspora spinosa]
MLVGIVRELVRDLVAECVAALITKIPRWIAEIGGTLGIGTPAVVAEAAGMIAKWVSKISDVITKLTRSLNKLQPLLKKLDEIWEGIKDALKGLRKADGPASTKPSSVDAPSPKPDAPDAPNSPDTSPSSTSPAGTSSSPDGTPNGGSPSTKSPDEPEIRDKSRSAEEERVPDKDKNDCGDPIDIASGDVILSQTDAELAGTLQLQLKRLHLSSYRVGRHFGETWSSTLDQRLEVDAEGVCFAADDGTLLFYPHPAPGASVTAVTGPRKPLTRAEDGSFTIDDAESGRSLHFAPRGAVLPLTAITDRNGNRVDFERDSAGTPVEVRHSGGYRIRVDSDDGLVTALYLREADNGDDLLLQRYEYEARRLTGVVNASGLPLKFAYDEAGRLTSWTDRNGSWYRYAYDHEGRVVQADGSGGFFSGTLQYDRENRVTYWTNSLGQRTAYHLNERGQTVREVDPLGNEVRMEWDEHDRLLSSTDQLGHTTRYDYDADLNLISVTRPDGSQARFEYNELQLPTTIIAPDGSVTRNEWDDRGNLVRTIDASGAHERFGYDENGHLQVAIDALGNVRRIETDAAGRPISITDPMGNTTRYERDGFGRVVAITDPLGRTTRFGWTVDGNLAWQVLPDGATERWRYDGEGNLRGYTDALGQTTHTEVTHFDLPSAEVRPDGTRLEFEYDTELRLTSVTNEQGLVWRYDYDEAGNLSKEVDFNGRAVTYRHDAAGRLVERTNGAGETTAFVRDSFGNVIERRSGDAIATFRYDEVGLLVEAMDNNTQVTFQRDLLGRVLAETINGRTVASAYDPVGRRVRRRTPSGAESVWDFDANSQPIALHTAGRTLGFAYDAAGREIRRTLGRHAALAQEWDPGHRLLAQTITGSEKRKVQHRSFTYRADGSLTGINDQLTGPRTFELDRAGRVTAVRGAGWTERYTYDAAGNITNASWPTANTSSDADATGDREYRGTLIKRAGKVRFEHDAQGRVVLRQQRRLSRKPETWRYFWDADDRLIGVLTPDGSRWRYRYDPLGRRIAKQRLAPDGVSFLEQVEFAWDGPVLVEQAHTDGVPNGPGLGDARVTVWDYEPGTFRPITQLERSPVSHAPQQWIDEQFYSIVTDLIGAPCEMVNDRGGIAWFHRTTLWGNTLDQSRAGAYTPLRFPGQYHDSETGLNYNFQRHYDPISGRYGSTDPLGLSAGPNPHHYVANPTSWIDPLGLQGRDCKKRRDEVRKGVERDGTTYKPEAGLLGAKKHGLDWTEGPARATKENKPQGQFGSPDDVEFAVQKGAELGKNNHGVFPLPEGHGNIEHLPGGGTRTPNAIFVKVYESGKVHAYPFTQ